MHWSYGKSVGKIPRSVSHDHKCIRLFFDEGEQLLFFYWCCIFVTFLSSLAHVESEVKI